MCTDSVNKEKERFDYLLEMINKAVQEGDKNLRKIFKDIVK